MRIAIVIHEFPPIGGGAATAAQQTARALVRENHEVLVVTAGTRGVLGYEFDNGVEIHRLPSLRMRTFYPGPFELLSFCASAALLLTRELRQFRAEGVISYFAVPAGVFATRSARQLSIPCVVSLRGSDVPGFAQGRLDSKAGRLAYPAIRSVLRQAHRLAPNSAVLANLARQFMPDIDGKMVIVRNGIESSALADRPASSGNEVLHLIQVGQLIKRKRVEVTLAALRLLSDVPIHLSIVGSGPLEKSLRHAALGLRVKFLGHLPRNQILALLRQHDVFIMTSLAEGMSNAMLEAIAAGLPIITTRNGSDDVVTSAACGLVIAPDDVDALVTCISELADVKIRERLSWAGLDYANTRTWATCAREMVELLTTR